MIVIDNTSKGNYNRYIRTGISYHNMAQHFLLSTQARTLSLMKVMRMTDAEAFETFKAIRWASTAGAPVCPRCGCMTVYTYQARRIFKCKGCEAQFSVTTDTIFASRKMPLRDILAAIAIFVNGAKGHSALQLSRDLDCQYKTAFVLAHKLREALSGSSKEEQLTGEIEVDGMFCGGYVKPANYRENRRDRRLKHNQSGKREVVVAMRQRGGKTLTHVFKTEDASVSMLHTRIAAGSIVYADEASHWDALHARFLTKRINHSQAYSDNGACTNQVESFFSRLRRAEHGTHHSIAGKYLSAYAAEMAWRENHRRVSNGEQYLMMTNAALQAPVSRQWKGYWQKAS